MRTQFALKMRIEVLSIFPEIFNSFLEASLIKKALEKKLLSITTTNIRDAAQPPHFHVDDTPYGGGAGMVMKPEPLCISIENAKQRLQNARTILVTPAGRRFDQGKARELSQHSELIIVCGRYEGIDQRVTDLLVDEELSVGDFVLMGGEVPAMAIIEAVTRLVPGVVGNEESIQHESFSQSALLLEAPHYTRPPEFRGLKVPEVLLSGNHQKIEAWRQAESRKRTEQNRPDLLKTIK